MKVREMERKVREMSRERDQLLKEIEREDRKSSKDSRRHAERYGDAEGIGSNASRRTPMSNASS